MNAKNIPCIECGALGQIRGSDYLDEEGPWSVQCVVCGRETDVWAYQREAWRQWRFINSVEES